MILHQLSTFAYEYIYFCNSYTLPIIVSSVPTFNDSVHTSRTREMAKINTRLGYRCTSVGWRMGVSYCCTAPPSGRRPSDD
jgi:hypothetical protein